MSKTKTDWAEPEVRIQNIAKAVRKQKLPKSPLLSDEQVHEIREMITQWVPTSEIAEYFKVKPMVICHIKAGRTYKHV